MFPTTHQQFSIFYECQNLRSNFGHVVIAVTYYIDIALAWPLNIPGHILHIFNLFAEYSGFTSGARTLTTLARAHLYYLDYSAPTNSIIG